MTESASHHIILQGYTEHILATGESWFGIHTSAREDEYPKPFQKKGDYIAMFQDKNRKELLVEGWIVNSNELLEKDDTLVGNIPIRQMIPYLENPYYLYVSRYKQDSVNKYMAQHPRSRLATDLTIDVDHVESAPVLTPVTVQELFARELQAIVIRDTRHAPRPVLRRKDGPDLLSLT